MIVILDDKKYKDIWEEIYNKFKFNPTLDVNVKPFEFDINYKSYKLNNGWSEEHCYKIFVYAENKKIKLLQCDGDDGNGYYGTGYHIEVKLKEAKHE